MAILDQYEMKVFFPAPAGEKRAQGFPANVCALVASCRENPHALLRLIRQATGGRRLGVIFEGTFGRDVGSLASALQRGKTQVLGQELFLAETDAEIAAALQANVEFVLLVAAEDTTELPAQKRQTHFLELRSSTDFVSELAAKGPVLSYSPADKALEVFGSEGLIIALLQALSSQRQL